MDSDFRGALEYNDSDQREREQEAAERRSRKRESWIDIDSWKPRKWLGRLHEEPDHSTPDHASETAATAVSPNRQQSDASEGSHGLGRSGRSFSLPQVKQASAPGWNRLKSILQRQPSLVQRPAAVVVAPNVNIVDELIGAGLSSIMLKMWFERDERGERRVPVLLQHLRIRVSDSLHPLSGAKAIFRIECEYANGQSRWVVYRQLRDFLSLHTHYRVSNAYNRNIEAMPDFPLTSVPYFNFLKSEGRDVERSEFARLQREALENYLVGLIRAVMFHPTANRLCRFLEISALSIALAPAGGWQHKGGVLKIEPVGKTGPFSRRGLGWREKRKSRWCAVRDSYLVVMEEAGELQVHDVFLLDSDFIVERPTRYLRKGLHMLHLDERHDDDETESPRSPPSIRRHSKHLQPGTQAHHKQDSSVRLALRKMFTIGSRRTGRSSTRTSRTSQSIATSRESSQAPTPLVDPSTGRPASPARGSHDLDPERIEEAAREQVLAKRKKKSSKTQDLSHRTFYIENAQMRLKVTARNERQMEQWIEALERAAATSHWACENRFGSFAPIRLNVAAQWLVDGRDYFWNVSRAILLAKERIFIMDWWLSPDMYLRRPGREHYRLDRLLERKAKEGVKIFVVLYNEVSNRTTPTDSNYAKQRLIGLHENIVVQRSPSHFQTGTLYWAHHEKMILVDDAIGFMGGIDLCFGRWDTPQHALVDENEAEQIWRGKDYSNPRVTDFHTLNKPEQDMYDRTKVPRMPWHDVGLQILGQPARDLGRHFVERWNYLLRVKNHSRSLPFLLPAPDFKPAQLTEQNLTGTCEMQICRSAGPWSMGTPNRTEDSVQNAYLKAIQLSEHFVYIENQFFITSTTVNDVRIENRIGDALVHRIIRAHEEGAPWRACIMIPLLPGFPFPVGHSEASAIRVILECQNRTTARGPDSIFTRLRREGIEPSDYISFFSLRGWGKLGGETLTTEQIYIHAKILIADDRVAIIGSANINERSQRGDRDSELAAVIRDTDMIDSTMAGQPFQVGRFSHTLRMRLMREHLGIDVDALSAEEFDQNMEEAEPMAEEPTPVDAQPKIGLSVSAPSEKDVSLDNGTEASVSTRDSPSIPSQDGSTTTPPLSDGNERPRSPSPPHLTASRTGRATSLSYGGSMHRRRSIHIARPKPTVDPNGFADPLAPEFFEDVWTAAAVHNTEIYRKVFHAIPDDTVTSWKQYREFVQHHERFTKPPARTASPSMARVPSEHASERAEGLAADAPQVAKDEGTLTAEVELTRPDLDSRDKTKSPDLLAASSQGARRPSRPDQPFEPWEREEMEAQLGDLVGNLVIYPTHFLEGEDIANNFLFPADRILPLPIYN
ncbi:phospholipase D [Auricularia subglabra TFB-10046 SS5]|nr:phospholipase D [Auricularia subglabra TFB-10046 SS5]